MGATLHSTDKFLKKQQIFGLTQVDSGESTAKEKIEENWFIEPFGSLPQNDEIGNHAEYHGRV